MRLRVIAVLSLASIPSLASATPRDSVPAPQGGPRIERTATAFRNPSAPADTSAVALQRSRGDVSKPVAIMLVGGAAIVLGSVVDNDVGELIVIGGVVAVLYGLYQYLK
jgi:hypothetical protein